MSDRVASRSRVVQHAWTPGDGYSIAALEELAVRAVGRAERAREHAYVARELAGGVTGRQAELYLREADAHERAARVNEGTAALYRRRTRRLERAIGSD